MAPVQWVMVPCGLQTGEKQKGSVSLSRVTMQARGGSGTLGGLCLSSVGRTF